MKIDRLEEFDIPEPESLEPKEVYAFFGLAAYWAQALEREAINFAVAVKMTHTDSLDRAVVERLWGTMESRTFGVVLRTARELVSIPHDVDGLLSEALSKRNHLIHRFFFDHATDFLSDHGRLSMMAQLQHFMKVFKNANDRLEPLTVNILERYGVSAERINKEWRELVESAGKSSNTPSEQ